MNADNYGDYGAARIAAAIGEPTRARMLYCLLDGRARTGTELAAVAEIATSTASTHLARLRAQRLVKVIAQGKHRYYSLYGPATAALLEALSVATGDTGRARFNSQTPPGLRAARTCYDHLAGALAVSLHDRCHALGWLTEAEGRGGAYEVTPAGARALAKLGIDTQDLKTLRRRFAYACLDWSERRPHLGGALGAALLAAAFKRRWVIQLDDRALTITRKGRTELNAQFGLDL